MKDNLIYSKLNDLAMLLIQIDVNDDGSLDALGNGVDNISNLESLPDTLKQYFTLSLEELEDIEEKDTEDRQLALNRIGELIENAINELDEIGNIPEDEILRDENALDQNDDTCKTVEATVFGKLLPDDSDMDIVKEYVIECQEFLSDSESALLVLEQDPEDMESIGVVFRAFHSIKGTSSFLGLDPIADFSHAAESFLSLARDGKIKIVKSYADLSLRSIDMLRLLIQMVDDEVKNEPISQPEGYNELLQVLIDTEQRVMNGEVDDPEKVFPDLSEEDETPLYEKAENTIENDDIPVPGQLQSLNETPTPAPVAAAPVNGNGTKGKAKISTTKSAAQKSDSSVRVRTDRLDHFVDIVGELVIAHSMIEQDSSVLDTGHFDLLKKVTHMGKIVRELQDLSMSMRMIPLKATFNKMARVVRDISQKISKPITFLTDGEDTEIDRNMVDLIQDPLLHMLRNAVDHGIEPAEERAKKGKSKAGTIKLSAGHSGGNIVVEIIDDGRGLDRNKILEKAISKGIVPPDTNMSDEEIYSLIFAPGFSTAEKVTEVSGRGVGLDVVKKNIEALRGRVDIESRPGQGSIFRLRLPLTLVITDGMLVKVGDERYIIPTINIDMSFRPTMDTISTIGGRGEMVKKHGSMLPIIRLHNLFSVNNAVQELGDGLLVIINEGSHRCALLVDQLLGQQQVVAKSLGEGMQQVRGVSGGAILGDGKVGLILDTAAISNIARNSVH